MLLIKNAHVFAPEDLGQRDLLVGGGKILAIEKKIELSGAQIKTWDAQNKKILPGFIDQHIHVIGAGGKRGFASMSPEIKMSELISVGNTTVVGLLGTDGATRSIHTLHAKVQALNMEGISAYMFTGYYGLDPNYLTNQLQNDLILIDRVLGCKIAIADVRSSFPSDIELLRLLREIRVGGMIGNKKGILHIHLGSHPDKMDQLFRLVEEHHFPIENISPTHVGRTKELFEQAIQFAKLGGIIDITTGASKYTEPYLSVLEALDAGVSIDKMTFSSDGNAGLDKLNEAGEWIGFRRAPIDQNLAQVQLLIHRGNLPISEAFKLITTNPAKNLGLKNKGKIEVGMDADICCLNEALELTDVFALGQQMMSSGKVIAKDSF